LVLELGCKLIDYIVKWCITTVTGAKKVVHRVCESKIIRSTYARNWF